MKLVRFYMISREEQRASTADGGQHTVYYDGATGWNVNMGTACLFQSLMSARHAVHKMVRSGETDGAHVQACKLVRGEIVFD